MLSNLLGIVEDVTQSYIAADDRIVVNDKELVTSIVVRTITSGIEKNISTVLRQLLIGDATFFRDKLSDDVHEALFQKTNLDFDNVSLLSQGLIAEIIDTVYGKQSEEEVLVKSLFDSEASKIEGVLGRAKSLFLVAFNKTKVS